MVVEEVVIVLSGGAPWGFRLQGGAEHKKPLQVAKVRKRSKACRAGLRESDELVSINDSPCGGLSHAQAMNLIDSSPGTLHIQVKRAPAGFQSVVLLTRAPSPRIDKEYRAALRAMSPPDVQQGVLVNSTEQRVVVEEHRSREGLTSPQGSEAYYGETDSDADVVHEKHRRPKHRSPVSSPGKALGWASSEEGPETTGYDIPRAAGVPRREVVYQPLQGEWSSLTGTSTENSSFDDQGPRDGMMEEDGGFQEIQSLPPLVSPEGARGALQLASRKQLVPMVGPVDNPVDEELTVTYKDKAKQAKLNRGDSQQEKQVKEARKKCRTIACLLTDAPNPHSKGVLMFKKRRQRSKKYTLTSFGCVEEDTTPQDSHEEEEDGILPGSESEFDEEGVLVAPDPTWDSDCLEKLDIRASASQPAEVGSAEDPGLTATSGKGAQLFEQQRKRAAEHAKRAAARELHAPTPPQPAEVDSTVLPSEMLPPISAHPPIPASAPAIGMVNGDVVIERSAAMAMGQPPAVPQTQIHPQEWASPPPSELPDMPASNVLNRTARPFAPGFISHRAATAPVVFKPNTAKKTRPAAATVPPSYPSPATEMQMEAPPFSPTLYPRPMEVPRAVSAPTTPTAPLYPSAPPSASLVSPTQDTYASPISATPVTFAPVHAARHQLRAPPTPSGRTGILQEAMRTRTKKPLFVPKEEKPKATPNPQLLSMVQNLDDRSYSGPEPGFEYGSADVFNLGAETTNFTRSKLPPPVAPKPRLIPAAASIARGGGKGAELFARRQTRMDSYVVDRAPQHPPAITPPTRSRDPSPSPSLPAHWKYSPNIRAPPPISYNPLLSPSCPPVVQRGPKVSEPKTSSWRGGRVKEGIKALDAMRRQPYQLNPAMFSYSPGPHSDLPPRDGPILVGSSLASPRQIPVKTARVYEVKRFSTPTPMSGPTILTPTVIQPRSATSLAEPIYHSSPASPPPFSPTSPPPRPTPTGALPQLPRLSSTINRSSTHYHGPSTAQSSIVYGGLQAAKQFKSAPELCPQRSSVVQAPKPHFVASRIGIQANVWRPGYMHH